MDENKTLDQWEQNLESMIQDLKKCQLDTTGYESCKPKENFCEKFFECELRKKYVLAVYESMNKGSGGGFEF